MRKFRKKAISKTGPYSLQEHFSSAFRYIYTFCVFCYLFFFCKRFLVLYFVCMLSLLLLLCFVVCNARIIIVRANSGRVRQLKRKLHHCRDPHKRRKRLTASL